MQVKDLPDITCKIRSNQSRKCLIKYFRNDSNVMIKRKIQLNRYQFLKLIICKFMLDGVMMIVIKVVSDHVIRSSTLFLTLSFRYGVSKLLMPLAV